MENEVDVCANFTAPLFNETLGVQYQIINNTEGKYWQFQWEIKSKLLYSRSPHPASRNMRTVFYESTHARPEKLTQKKDCVLRLKRDSNKSWFGVKMSLFLRKMILSFWILLGGV